MKKLLAGCLVIVLIGGIGLAVASFFAYRAAQPLIDNAAGYLAGLKTLGSLPDLDARLENKSPYTAPANGELTPSQVERFIKVQESVSSSLGQRFNDLKVRAARMEKTGSVEVLSPREMLSALSELGNVIVDARRVQVDALNGQRFSQSEYEWVRGQVYRAAGLEIAGGLDFRELERIAREGAGGVGITAPEVPAVQVPARNRELVKAHVERLREWLPLAFFGL